MNSINWHELADNSSFAVYNIVGGKKEELFGDEALIMYQLQTVKSSFSSLQPPHPSSFAKDVPSQNHSPTRHVRTYLDTSLQPNSPWRRKASGAPPLSPFIFTNRILGVSVTPHK